MIKGVDFFGLFLIFIKEYIVYWYGCILYFGVCEYVMGVILFGIVLYGFIWVYGGIFLQFFDYMCLVVWLVVLMDIDIIYVWMYDLIGFGEDGFIY